MTTNLRVGILGLALALAACSSSTSSAPATQGIATTSRAACRAQLIAWQHGPAGHLLNKLRDDLFKFAKSTTAAQAKAPALAADARGALAHLPPACIPGEAAAMATSLRDFAAAARYATAGNVAAAVAQIKAAELLLLRAGRDQAHWAGPPVIATPGARATITLPATAGLPRHVSLAASHLPPGPFIIKPIYCGKFTKAERNQNNDYSGLIFKYTNTSNSLTASVVLTVNFTNGSTVLGSNVNGTVPGIGPGQSATADVGAVGSGGLLLAFTGCELMSYAIFTNSGAIPGNYAP